MSTTIDQKVVEMRFDNKNFEANVATTMSTLDKFKQKLNLSGATKGLEEINSASKRIDMSGLGTAVDTVRTKFSALEVMGVTALANITNSVVNASKRMLRSFTVEPIKTGFNEYELKMGSIQTIMASTGESLDVVNQKLNELNKYSDDTIYSFQDMTQNIGKFTNAGVKLDDAVAAIKGISNEAAISGANANEASRAMYNFAQALSAGYVKLIDWKSIENANMATIGFKEQLIETAVEMGTLTKVTDGYKTSADTVITSTKNFNESLNDQWMTSDVLITTLKKYADTNTDIGKKATEAATEVKTFSQMMDTLKESAQSGWAQTWEIIFGDFNEGKTLWTNINKVLGGIIDKMNNVRNSMLSGALGSSWDKLYEKINAAGIETTKFQERLKETAKKHGIAVDDLIKEYGSLEKAMAAGKVKNYKDIIKETIKSFLGLSDATKEVKKTTEDYAEIVKRVIRGDFGNGEERVKKLTEAGYNYAKVQNKVNEELGYSYRHLETLTEEQKKNADSLVKLSDEQLKNKGYTKEQIEALRELEKAADETGSSIDELINGVTEMSGRDKLLEVFKTIGKSISDIFGAIKKAWDDTFDTDLSASSILSGIIDALYDMSEGLAVSEKTIGQIERIVKGFFAITKLFASFNTKLLLVGIDIIKGLFGLTNVDILEFVARLGDGVVKIKDMIFNSKLLDVNLEKIADTIVGLIEKFVGWFDTFKSWPGVAKSIETAKKAIEGFTTAVSDLFSGKITVSEFFEKIWNKITSTFENLVKLSPRLEKFVELIKSLFNSFKTSNIGSGIFGSITAFFDEMSGKFSNAYDIGKNVIDGIINGLKDGTMTLGGALLEIGKMIIDVVCEVLGIHSPSRVFMMIGAMLISGLLLGLSGGEGTLLENLKELGLKMIESIKSFIGNALDFIKGIDFGAVIATAFGVGILLLINKIVNVVEKFVNPFDKVFGTISKVVEGIGKAVESNIKAEAWEKRSKALLNIALAIGVLAGSVALLANMPQENLWNVVGVLGTLAGIITGMLAILVLLDTKLRPVRMERSALSLVAIAGSLLILVGALKLLSTIEVDNLGWSFAALVGMMLGLVGLMSAVGIVASNANSTDMVKIGAMLLMMSGAMLIMAFVIKTLSELDARDIVKGISVIASVSMLFAAIIAVSYFAGEHASKAGGMLIKMAIAMGIMAAVIKLMAMLEPSEVARGIGVIAAVEALFMAIIAVSWLAGANASKAGTMMLLMSGAMLIMTFVIKQLTELSDTEIDRGLKIITRIELLFAAIIAVSYFAGNNAMKAGSMLILMSGALLILTGVLFVLSKLDPEGLGRALGIVTVLELLFAGLIGVTYFAKDCMKNLIVITVAIGLLVGALIGLSFIDPQKLGAAAASLSAVMGVFALLIYATSYMKKMGKGFGKFVGALAGLTLVVAGLGAIIAILSNEIKDPQSAIAAAGALSILLMTLSVAMYLLSYSESMSVSAIAKSIVTLGLLTGVLALLALVIGMMKDIDPKTAITNAVVLSGLLLVLTGVGAIMALLGTGTANILLGAVGLAALVGVMALLALVLGMMKDLDPETAIGHATVLSALLLVLTGVAAALALIGFAIGNILLGSVALVALGGVVWVLAYILKSIGEMGIQNGMPNVIMLGSLLTLLADVCFKLALVGPLALIGVTALASLTLLMGAIGVFAVAIGALVEKFPILETFLDKGIDILSKLAYGIGSIVGNLVSGFMGGIADGLPHIGLMLSQFAINSMPFITLMKNVDSSVIKGVGILAGAVLALVAADLIAGIASFMQMGSSFSSLGLELSAFAVGALPFIAIMQNLDPAVCEGVKSLAEAMLILTASDLLSGISNLLGLGGSSLADFGAELALFGPSIAAFAASVSGLDDHSLKAMDMAAEAGKKLAEMAKTFPNTGGFLAKVFGDNTADEFGKQLEGFGSSLMAFGKSVNGIDQYTDSIESSVSAGTALAELADAIPESGGFIADFFGDNAIDDFGAKLEGFGKGLMAYGESVNGVGEYTSSMKSATAAGQALAELAEVIPESGGFIADFFGDNSIDTFGTSLKAFGDGITAYGESVQGIESYVDGIEASKEVVGQLIEITNQVNHDLDTDAGEMDISRVGNGLKAFAVGAADFATAMSGVSDVDGMSTKVDTLLAIVNNVNDNLKTDLGTMDIVKVGNGLRAFAKNASSFATDMAVVTDVEGLSGKVDALSAVVNKVNTEFVDEFGTEDIVEIGEGLRIFAKNAVEFYSSMLSIGDISAIIVKVNSLVDVVKSTKLEEESGLKDIGRYLDNFGAKVAKFATNMTEAGDISAHVTTVESVVNLIKNIKKEFSSDGADISDVGRDITDLGKKIGTFARVTKDVDTERLSSITSGINSLVAAAKNLAGADFEKITTLGTALESLGKTSIEGFVSSFESGLSDVITSVVDMVDAIESMIRIRIPKFTKAGTDIIKSFASGMKKGSTNSNKAAKSIAASAASSVASAANYTKFYNAGKYLVDGFAAGITANTWKAEAKATAMANAAEKAAKEALDINSPSKVFRRLGFSVPEGFAQGIDRLSGLVKTSAISMTDVAVSNVGKSIARIAGLVNDNIDVQPTIRPVLDLSDVRSGVGTLGGMLNFGPSVDVLANVGSINTAMNRRIQNGATNDVVSAIKKLGKDLGNLERNSYNINGIHYEEGDDVAEALHTIVRAAVRERRV